MTTLLALYYLANSAGFSGTTRLRVKESNGHSCAKCGETNPQSLTVHHLLPRSIARALSVPESIYNSSCNGLCLCRLCHPEADEASFENPMYFYDLLAKEFPELEERRGHALVQLGLLQKRGGKQI